MDEHTTETVKHVVDGLAILATLGTVIKMLPAIAATFSVVWTAIRIYETRTVQGWVKRLRRRKTHVDL